MVRYSKKRLNEITRADKFGNDEHNKAINDLMQRVYKNEHLSIAEANFICKTLHYSIPKGEGTKIDISIYRSCEDYLFKRLYITYYNNFNGIKPAFDAVGPKNEFEPPILEEKEINTSQKQSDIKILEKIHQEWLPNIQKFNHKEKLLKIIASEANQEIKQIKKDKLSGLIGGNLYNAKLKSISLQSKYIYLTVKAFFEESSHNAIIVELNGHQIHIDEDSMAHIMFRHYAGIVKQFDTGKTFHSDRSINPFNLPEELKKIIEMINSANVLPGDQIEHIPIEFNSIKYSIYINKVNTQEKGIGNISIWRLKTFYPIGSKEEIDKLKDYNKVSIIKSLSVFVKK